MPTTTIDKLSAFLAILCGMVICVRHSMFVETPLAALTAIEVVILLLSIRKPMGVCLPLWVLVGVLSLSLAMHPGANPPRNWERLGAMLVGMVLFSPIITTDRLQQVRKWLFVSLFYTISVMVAVSFLIWLYAIATDQNVGDRQFYINGFRGIFNIGMNLSPGAGFVAIVSAHHSIEAKTLKHRLAWLGLSLTGITTCVAAGSRIAVAALIVALICMAVLNRAQIGRMIGGKCAKWVSIAAVAAFAIATPRALEVIRYKTDVAERHGSLIYSRAALWETRVEEWKSSPILGIGYANAFPCEAWENQPGHAPGKIEPGSGWLSLTSYGGLLALGAFLWFLIDFARRLFTHHHAPSTTPRCHLLFPLLLFFLIHAIAEGWLLFAGSLLFPLFWLTCSIPFNTISSPCKNE